MKRLFENQYLTFDILTDGDILWKEMHIANTASLSAVTISYSRDNGLTWNDVASSEEGTAINARAGEKLLFKGNNNTYGYYFHNVQETDEYILDYCNFGGTASFDLEGNIMSLIYGDDFRNKINLENNYIFNYLFSNSNVVNAKNLKLPATTLADRCYLDMFYNCSSLTSAPELPATTLADRCYQYMFGSCSSLESAPELPATTLAEGCYSYMFYGCSSLVSAPELPATTLADRCYQYMFGSCSSLTSAPELPAITLAVDCYVMMFRRCSSLTNTPELPATTLAVGCYNYMFGSCSSLTSAPELPATTLADGCYAYMFAYCSSLTSAPELPATTLAVDCYESMFEGCSKLNYIKAMFMITPSESYTNSWVGGVSSTGTFVKNVAATWDVNGSNGIPCGWTVETASA